MIKMVSKKKILVIGGGFSGIGSIKCLKEEGFDPICYEKTSNSGGTWYYREETPIGMPSIMPTTVINHSKEMGSLTDFVPDKSYPNYMRHHDLLRLFNEIGNKFDCFRHIVHNREVLKVKQTADYEETGCWNVEVKNTETGEISHEIYDGVMVGIGHITYPKIPTFPGMEKYKGKIMHTHSLKEVHDFKNKKVVVVGIGCSGLDAAVEISNVAAQVYLSTRSGAWVLPRVGPYGLPFDFAMLRRFATVIQSLFGYKLGSWYMEKYYVNQRFNHNLYNLKPVYHCLSKDPITNDVLPSKLISGAIKMRKDIKCFTENGIIFENETKGTEADVVVMATGYTWKFPFLGEDIIRKEEDIIQLYKCVYPPHLKHHTLAIIGFILPFGPGFPLGELQCRWAAQVFSGKYLPPSEEEMKVDIRRRHEENLQRYSPSDKMSVRVDYIPYGDEIASLFDAKPNLLKLFFTDQTLYWALMFGPSLPYQYRLQGPHKWDGARKAILTVYDRVRYPFTEEEYKKSKKPNHNAFFLKYLVTFLLVAFWLSQGETSMNFYILALLLPYIISWKGFYKKYFACLFLLPFYVSWSGFVSSYFVTIFIPILIASLT